MSAAEGAQRAGTGRAGAYVSRPAAWRGPAVPAALMLAAFTFNTAENLPVGLLEPISRDLGVSVSAVGLLVTGYGGTVAV
ncbi:MFS transporter, partial [Streptomyces sp. NPDC001759]